MTNTNGGMRCWAIFADGELDQIVHEKEDADREKHDLQEMGFVVRVKEYPNEQAVYDALGM